VVTAIELGDLDAGYRAIDTSAEAGWLYSLTCPLMLGLIIVAVPKYTKNRLALVPKNSNGVPLTSKVEALNDPRGSTPYLLPPKGTTDRGTVVTAADTTAIRETKEWQAIMDHLRSLPVRAPGELPTVPMDAHAAEVRAIRQI